MQWLHQYDFYTNIEIFNNFNFLELDWDPKYEKYISIDYSKFTRIGADLENTPEQQVAFLKLNVCENYYIIIYLLLEA